MSIDPNKRKSFDAVAEIYNEVRTGYPEMLVEDILSLSRIPDKGRILEIGCGSGNATIAFARRGYTILGIELGANLAALAVQNCQNYPDVKILNLAFEDWDVEDRAFDLVIAADALHWIPPRIAYPKAARAIKDTGSAAFFWWVPVDPQTDWSREIDQLYEATTPQFVNPDKRFTAEWLIEIVTRNFEASGCYTTITTRKYVWRETLTRDQYVKGLWTFSMHKDICDAEREKLYARIGDVIDRYGGKVEQPQSVVLFHGGVKR